MSTPSEAPPLRTILCVDDDPVTLTLYVATLRHGGYHTITASSGEAALRIVHTLTPDLIILDLLLPGMGGFEVAVQLAQAAHTTHIPIVMISGVTEHHRQEQGLSFGAAVYLTKPVLPAVVLETVARLLKAKGA